MAEPAYLDLMSFARGQETANAMNWQDVFKDIASRQQEEALMQNQAKFGLQYPLAQLRTEDTTNALLGNRQAAQAQNEMLQQSMAVPKEQRTDFILNEVQRRLGGLNPADPQTQGQFASMMGTLQNQYAQAVQVGDRAGAEKIAAFLPTMFNPYAGKDAAEAKRMTQSQQLADMINQAVGGKMFAVGPDGSLQPIAAYSQQYRMLQPQTQPQIGEQPGANMSYTPGFDLAAQPRNPLLDLILQGGPVQQPVVSTQQPAWGTPAGTGAMLRGMEQPIQPTQPQPSTPWFRPWVYNAADQAAQNREQSRNFLLQLFGLTPGSANQQPGAYR